VPARTRHPRLTAAACALYGVAIRLYPAELRLAFGEELRVTFRTRVEDVLNGDFAGWVAFAAHLIADGILLRATLLPNNASAVSLLGLSDGDTAHGALDRAAVDAQGAFVVAGFALAIVGWFAYFVILPRYVR
jgi:hypothetical protein